MVEEVSGQELYDSIRRLDELEKPGGNGATEEKENEYGALKDKVERPYSLEEVRGVLKYSSHEQRRIIEEQERTIREQNETISIQSEELHNWRVEFARSSGAPKDTRD